MFLFFFLSPSFSTSVFYSVHIFMRRTSNRLALFFIEAILGNSISFFFKCPLSLISFPDESRKMDRQNASLSFAKHLVSQLAISIHFNRSNSFVFPDVSSDKNGTSSRPVSPSPSPLSAIGTSWQNCRRLIFVPRSAQKGYTVGHWPIPEAFYPDTNSDTLVSTMCDLPTKVGSGPASHRTSLLHKIALIDITF